MLQVFENALVMWIYGLSILRFGFLFDLYTHLQIEDACQWADVSRVHDEVIVAFIFV